MQMLCIGLNFAMFFLVAAPAMKVQAVQVWGCVLPGDARSVSLSRLSTVWYFVSLRIQSVSLCQKCLYTTGT